MDTGRNEETETKTKERKKKIQKKDGRTMGLAISSCHSSTVVDVVAHQSDKNSYSGPLASFPHFRLLSSFSLPSP
jgi:hypothetical protein